MKKQIAKTRERVSASLEDYLETILHLSSEGEPARSKDISEKLKVSKASVTGALRKLKNKRLVHYKPYSRITHASKGSDAAEEVSQIHDVLRTFFEEVLGVDKQTAQKSACLAEHSMGKIVVARLMDLTEFLDPSREFAKTFRQKFSRYSKRRAKTKTVKPVAVQKKRNAKSTKKTR
jgi:DtxR family Mn-dependent transcriptional regulator